MNGTCVTDRYHQCQYERKLYFDFDVGTFVALGFACFVCLVVCRCRYHTAAPPRMLSQAQSTTEAVADDTCRLDAPDPGIRHPPKHNAATPANSPPDSPNSTTYEPPSYREITQAV